MKLHIWHNICAITVRLSYILWIHYRLLYAEYALSQHYSDNFRQKYVKNAQQKQKAARMGCFWS